MALTSTTKIAVKVNGRKSLGPPKKPSEVFWEIKNFNKVVVISLKKDKLRLLLVRLPTGFKDLLIVCGEGRIFKPRSLISSVNIAVATLFGDSEDAAENQKLHDQGKAQQRSAEQ